MPQYQLILSLAVNPPDSEDVLLWSHSGSDFTVTLYSVAGGVLSTPPTGQFGNCSSQVCVWGGGVVLCLQVDLRERETAAAVDDLEVRQMELEAQRRRLEQVINTFHSAVSCSLFSVILSGGVDATAAFSLDVE